MSQYLQAQYMANHRRRKRLENHLRREGGEPSRKSRRIERLEIVAAEGGEASRISTSGGARPSLRCINGMTRIYEKASQAFKKRFIDNDFGVACSVCDRLWFQNDMKMINRAEENVLLTLGSFVSVEGFRVCQTCRSSLKRGVVPKLATTNGFVYPNPPPDLPPLDPISERLISARLPFMCIRRLRHAAGSHSILGQIINVPVDVPDMIRLLPRNIDNDYAFNVSIKKHSIHKSSYLNGFVKKSTIKKWLDYLVGTPLYRRYGIVIDEHQLNNLDQQSSDQPEPDNELETVDPSSDFELLIGQQQTLLWNEDMCLEIAPGQNKVPLSLIFDECAEELSFPDIYFGQPRSFNPDVHVTPFMMATSELRRRDRRGAKPQHLLYMAVKILRLRVSEGLQNTFKCMGTANITRGMLKDRTFLETCIERNLSFLKSIPNSVQYWQQRKRDVFAMIRQLGKPTTFMTLSANETRWPKLLKILHKLSDEHNIDLTDPIQQLTALQRTTLVNEDSVTCCIYFNRLVDSLMYILSSKKFSPLGEHYVVDYFKRIEFQHRGSPHAHILLWLNNDPREAISEDMPATVELIDFLCSVNANVNQIHKHTFTCYKRNEKHCRFNIPYWPMERTRILLPMSSDNANRHELIKKSEKMRENLNIKVYETLDEYLSDCNCSYDNYLNVIRASLHRPTVFLKRSMVELWTNPYIPWIANELMSNMDFQFILEEYSCAAYVVEYVNKTNRGISNLHLELIKLQEEYPDQDYVSLLKKVSIKMLNSIEMCAQEAAWYLLRQPMSEASRKVEFIPTMWPHERIKSRKHTKVMDEEGIGDDSTDVWTLNIIQKYEKREGLDDICLADFVAHYTKHRSASMNAYKLRSLPRVVRWRGYKMTELNDYKREMVLLFLPFRNETCDILDHNKFIDLFDQNETLILNMFKKYDCDINLEQIVEEYLRIIEENATDDQQNITTEKHDEFVRAITMEPNDDDIEQLPTGALAAVVKKRTNVMSKQDYCTMVRATNVEQRSLILHLINILHSFDGTNTPLQIFFTGPAGCGKTFTLRILMETYNRFSQTHNSLKNAYVACASTGKAAIAIGGTTVHSAFRITMARRHNSKLGFETLQLYRNAFAGIKAIIIDEVSMIGADVLNIIHTRLQDITGNYDDPFGGIHLIFCGDLRQLPPVNARPVFKPCRNSILGPVLWQSLNFYPLVQVMRQTDIEFSSILTKIGNGESLTDSETKLIESRFRTAEWCRQNVPNAIRLFHRNIDVERYNNETLRDRDGLNIIVDDIFTGYRNAEQLTSARTKLHKMSVVETGGLPYILRLSIGMPYMITTNIDVEDGLVNGAIGELKYIEHCEDDSDENILRLWMKFESHDIGATLKIKSRPLVYSKPGQLQTDWVPFTKRSTVIKLGTITCKRIQFPIVSACSLTVHKSQGGTFSEIVFDYDKCQEQQLVYVGLSRVTSMDGLYLTNSKNNFKFIHSKGSNSPRIVELRTELRRLSNHQQPTISGELLDFIETVGHTCSFISFNVQSLKAHSLDISTDNLLTKVDILALSETWLNNCSDVSIVGYVCIAEFKRPHSRAGGVAIYQKTTASIMATVHEIDRLSEEYDAELSRADNYGDICAIEVALKGIKTLFFIVYISPETTYKEKLFFLTRNLFLYSQENIPIVVSGDFNIDVSKQENKKLIDFMSNYLKLRLVSDPSQATTLGGTCIDLVFVRNINAESRRYVSYFSYHRPILSLIHPAD